MIREEKKREVKLRRGKASSLDIKNITYDENNAQFLNLDVAFKT
jgi:hypothetical protein